MKTTKILEIYFNRAENILWIWRKKSEHESSFHDYLYSDARAKRLLQTMTNNVDLLEYASLNPHDKQRIDFENGIWKDYTWMETGTEDNDQ